MIVVATCLGVAAGLGYLKFAQIQAAIAFAEAFPEPMETVQLFVALEEVWQPTTSVTAETVAIQAIEVATELAGRIVEVGFAPGATVRAGQLLVRLDTSEERAELAAARADARLASLALARNRKLITSGAAAEEARDRSKAQFDRANADVTRLQAIIDKKTLRAPFDARAGLHELEPGQYLSKAAVITRLIGIDDQIWIDFTLPQQQATVAQGEAVLITTGTMTRPFFAEIIARDAFVNTLSRNIRFRALADNSELRLYPGSLVTVAVPLGSEQVATVVPVTAVRRDAFGANVYVLRSAEKGVRAPYRAEKRSVTLGPQRKNLVVITSGLDPGEQIAADGAFKLRQGILVQAAPTAVSRMAGDTPTGGL
ncbi:MAG: efflux RND transporter periplasmic adaptor subunit [Pseudomonadales bacterium]